MTKRDAIVVLLEIIAEKPRSQDLSESTLELLAPVFGKNRQAKSRSFIARRACLLLADLLVGNRVEGVE